MDAGFLPAMAGANTLIQAVGPGETKPDYSYFPWMDTLQKAADGMVGTMTMVMVIVIAVGAALVVIGKIGHMSGATGVGVGLIVLGLIMAAIVAQSGDAVQWFGDNFQLFGGSGGK